MDLSVRSVQYIYTMTSHRTLLTEVDDLPLHLKHLTWKYLSALGSLMAWPLHFLLHASQDTLPVNEQYNTLTPVTVTLQTQDH